MLMSFGTASMTQPGVDCPPDSTPGGWERWCDCVFAGDPGTLVKCKNKLGAALFTPPWTSVGAGARGIPKPGNWLASAVSTAGDVFNFLNPTAAFSLNLLGTAGQIATTAITAPLQAQTAAAKAQSEADIAAISAARQQNVAKTEAKAKTATTVLFVAGGALVTVILAGAMLKKRRQAPAKVAGYRR
jgi:hypothetical protein